MKNLWQKLNDNPRGQQLKLLALFLLVLTLTHFWSSGFRDVMVWGSFATLLLLGALKKLNLRFNLILFAAGAYLLWALVSVFYSKGSIYDEISC